MFKNKYRIVTDAYNGFECQKKRWWFPVWLQMDFSNTHVTLEKAKAYIENDGKVVATFTRET